MRKRKYLCGILAALMTLTVLVLPVSAIDVNETSNGGTATVSYNNDSTWTAAIPMYVAPNNVGQQNVSAYEVAVKDVVIGDNQQLAATVEYSGYVTEANGVKIPYQLYDCNGEEIQSGDTILSKSAGEPGTEATITFGAALTDSPKYAGVYTDTATFAFTAKDKVYTLDDINNDEHLFAIGKTKPEYVVAKFSDDFSQVTMFANGDNSDGLMKDWLRGNSPTYTYKDTLKQANVQTGVVSIGDFAFYDCEQLEKISLADTVTSLGTSSFEGCQKLTSVRIPDSVITIGDSSFAMCWSLSSVVLSDQLTTIGFRGFGYCSALESITIPSSTTSIGDAAFVGISLKEIHVAKDNLYFCDVDGVLFNKNKTVLYQYPGGKEATDYVIPGTVNTIGEYAFEDCTLTNITIPESVTTIEPYAFLDCDSLVQITLPDSVTRLGEYAFNDCQNLETVILSNSLTEIEDYTFSGNSWKLYEITIPKSVTRIGYHVFNKSFMKTIYGASGSYAETWAAENGYTFIAQ